MKKIILCGMSALLLACNPSQEAFHFDEMTYSPSETVFRLFAPADAKCVVVLGGDSLPMALGSDSIWTITAKGDHKGKTYEFVVNGQASPGVFAKAVTVNGEKAVVVDMRDSNPEGWESDVPVRRPAQDIVVYEMHHRDFSIARPDAKYPGKYLALTEPWAIGHLQKLGINAVHILPSYDYGSVDETRLDEAQYNWGYDPVNYNVPEGSYSTDPTDPLCRIREFKQMVQALHKAGIAVILDVVYNHTFDIDHSNFQRTYPDYYYRIREYGGTGPLGREDSLSTDGNLAPSHPRTLAPPIYSNGSGCGNETASEQPMMRRFMVESVKYWVNEYHIDGFRFDLMGCHDIETMNTIRRELDTIDPALFTYGEGWSAGECALPAELLATKANVPQLPRIAAFSDELRDALRGPFSDDTKPGWLGGAPDCEESVKFGIAGCISHPQVDMAKVNYSKAPWANEPTQMISYVSCHDDMCLVDRLKASIPKITDDQLIRLDLLAQTAVFTSQGVPFMLSGEELLRTKLGVHNSYNSPDSINHLEWANKERYSQVFDYYCRLIELRKNHPAFRLGSADLVRQHLEFLPVTSAASASASIDTAAVSPVVAFRLKEHAGDDPWGNIVVILNSSSQQQRLQVPQGRYTVVCQDGRIDEQGLGTIDGDTATVAPFSALILHD